MRKIRVLIVDDSALVRQLLTQALADDPDILVVGTAQNGRQGLIQIQKTEPDLVILDVEMPEMDGLQMVSEIRKLHARLPVVMFSNLTETGAQVTLDALTRGASDYVTKPASENSRIAVMQRIQGELLPKIKGLCPGVSSSLPLHQRSTAMHRPGQRERVDVVAVGVSTGGPNALAALLPEIPADFPVPLLIVQHMPPIFTKHLADRLASKSRITIREATEDEPLRPAHAFIAPGNYHMVLGRGASQTRLKLHQGPPENSCRPAVDVLFRSVAEVFRGHSLGLVLTGMGRDGVLGCRAIAETGGQIVVQDEASSVVWGMPGMVVSERLADRVLPLHQIAGEIVRRVASGRAWRGPLGAPSGGLE